MNVAVNHIGTWDGPVKGSYSGLLRDEPATPAGCGTAVLTSTATGEFTLRFAFAGRSFRTSGVFDAEGIVVVELKRPGGLTPLSVRLTASTAPLVDQVVGEVTDGVFQDPGVVGGSFTAAFSLDRTVWNTKTNQAPQAGPYTMVLGADAYTQGLGTPLGDSAAALTVSAAGKAKWVGKLADGTAINVGGLLSKDGRLPVYAPLYKKLGMLCGWVRLTEVPEISDGGKRRAVECRHDDVPGDGGGGFAGE